MAWSRKRFTDGLPMSDRDNYDGSEGKTLFTDDIDVLDVVDFPCLVDDDTMKFLRSHGRILFLSRGPPGSGKGTVAERLHELYPGSRIYWSDKMFLTPLAPPRTKETLSQSHELCLQKITKYMQQNEAVIINRNTNMTVWEASPYLRIAATYGYTVIILNIDKNFILKPEVLAVTNSKGLDQRWMTNRLKQWEHIYPYAMGWSPRPRDAAFLLRRYRELSAALADKGIILKPVQCEQFFPFCIARLCWFGWDERDRSFCHSEPVEKAYGSKDTITVFGYAMVCDLVMAVVVLTEAQAALMGGSEQPANLETAISRHAGNRKECDEMVCTVGLQTFVQNESDETVVLEEGAVCCELPPPSRVSFILLGSATDKAIKYSSALARASLLRHHMHSWRDTGAAPKVCVDTDGVSVYGKLADTTNETCLLIVDKKTVRLDTVFTGYYQAHTSRSSGRDRMWSTGNDKCESQDRRTFHRYMQGTATMPTPPRKPNCYSADVVQRVLDSVDAPCLKHGGTQHFLRYHGRLLVMVRGPPGSGKDIVAARLGELYTSSSKQTALSEPSKPTTTSVPLGDLNKMEDCMKGNAPMLYYYTETLVLHITRYLALASKYGYTVIIIDMPHKDASESKAPYKAMGESNEKIQWEEVHPFATGWSPRPKDAAQLLQRFRQIRNILKNEDSTLAPKDVASSHVYPFCLARVCLFGSSVADKDYCLSEKVMQAYGRSDTLRVFGYAVTQGFVFAMVKLTDDQASLTGRLDSVDENNDVGEVTRQLSLSLGFQTWDEVGCIVDMAKFTEGCDDGNNLHFVGKRIGLEDLQLSRITFMPLGSIDGTEYSYSKAVSAPWLLLCSKLRSWRAAEINCERTINEIEVYGSAVSTDNECLLLVDHATTELDVVFTGYYQPYRTSRSNHSRSHAQNTGSKRLPFNRDGHYKAFSRFH
ncbi:uncharacterized protein LOC119174441 isoform X2 [Rhipicephalus microplus]|uniref:uncharacterized protein LOC119174441 isoform X2 n=1 Tax=Rhipicephalus microplus TaxID=6941 RepID=UPI003F6AB822